LKPKKSLLVTDLDNTLFDWFEIWYRPFKAMLDELAIESGIAAEALEADFKKVHQKYGTSEYAFAIEELQSLQIKHPGEDLAKKYQGAIDKYREIRRQVLTLYPTVRESLEEIRDRGTLIVAYTESLEFYTRYRLRKLGLDSLLDYLYSPEDNELPDGLSAEQIRAYSPEHYKLAHTLQRHTRRGELKPNPKILGEIISEVGGSNEAAIYVGDSLMKDVVMAQTAGVTDVYAKYGEAQKRPEYELLRRVTHWKPSAVQTEKVLTEGEVKPSFVLLKTFSEILTYFEFGGFNGRRQSG
jgi:phosphoglycolate phosphatase-like HAD superfamily hydrolase